MFGVLLQPKLHFFKNIFLLLKEGSNTSYLKTLKFLLERITYYYFTDSIFVCIFCLIGRILPTLFRNVFFLNGILVSSISIFVLSHAGTTKATADKHGTTDLQIHDPGLSGKLRHPKATATLQKHEYNETLLDQARLRLL